MAYYHPSLSLGPLKILDLKHVSNLAHQITPAQTNSEDPGQLKAYYQNYIQCCDKIFSCEQTAMYSLPLWVTWAHI